MQERPELRRLRAQIDKLDRRIVALLNARARLAMRAAAHKTAPGARSPARERQVLAHIVAGNRGPLSAKLLRLIYKAIMQASLALQRSAARRGP